MDTEHPDTTKARTLPMDHQARDCQQKQASSQTKSKGKQGKCKGAVVSKLSANESSKQQKKSANAQGNKQQKQQVADMVEA